MNPNLSDTRSLSERLQAELKKAEATMSAGEENKKAEATMNIKGTEMEQIFPSSGCVLCDVNVSRRKVDGEWRHYRGPKFPGEYAICTTPPERCSS